MCHVSCATCLQARGWFCCSTIFGMAASGKLVLATVLATVVVSFATSAIQSVAILDQTALAEQLAPAPAAPATTVSRKVGAADATTSSPTYLGGNPTKCWNYYYVAGAYAFGIVFQTAFAALMYYYTNRGTYEPPLCSPVHALSRSAGFPRGSRDSPN